MQESPLEYRYFLNTFYLWHCRWTWIWIPYSECADICYLQHFFVIVIGAVFLGMAKEYVPPSSGPTWAWRWGRIAVPQSNEDTVCYTLLCSDMKLIVHNTTANWSYFLFHSCLAGHNTYSIAVLWCLESAVSLKKSQRHTHTNVCSRTSEVAINLVNFFLREHHAQKMGSK